MSRPEESSKPPLEADSRRLPPEILRDQEDQLRRLSRPLSPLPAPSVQTANPPPDAAPLRAVLFDVYGTLFQSASGDVGTIRGTAPPSGSLPLPSLLRKPRFREWEAESAFRKEVERIHQEKVSRGIPYPEVDVIRVWSRILAPEAPSLEEIAQTALWFEMSRNPVWPMPGARELLRNLAAGPLPLGIVSNAQYYTALLFPALLDLSLEDCGFRRPELIAWSYTLGRSKPDPQLFRDPLKALEAEGISPEEVLYIGNDRRNDVYTAHQAGCRTCLFAGDGRSLRERPGDSLAGDLVPDFRIRSLTEILPLLSHPARPAPRADRRQGEKTTAIPRENHGTE